MPKLHVDTDVGGDIDDLCALAMVFNWPDVELLAVTTHSDDQGRRAGYVEHALTAAAAREATTTTAHLFLSWPVAAYHGQYVGCLRMSAGPNALVFA